ncbi:hypothetical protein EJ07DRAFT_16176, partial [Lizonia empirigonia]
YTALLYVWGSTCSPQDYFLCNDVPVAVTASCYSALKHLRVINESFDIRIDAVCINQSEQHDTAQQIGLVGNIYPK